jgi:hypothetical protein
MSAEKPTPDPDRPSTKAAERLAVIVDAAERAALSVIDDAEKEAQRYLEEAKGRADRVAAERLRELADELEREAEGRSPAAPKLAPVDLEAEPAIEDADGGSAEPAPEAEEPEGVERGRTVRKGPIEAVPAPAQTSHPGSAAARLLATQMAVSGSSREEIEMRLRSGFEIEDASEILDAILGPEE